jgi:hypothetical protein
MQLLSSVQSLLRAGKTTRALQLLDEHANKFGSAARLHEEVRAARVAALCAATRRADAEAELEKLQNESPASPYLERLQRACW